MLFLLQPTLVNRFALVLSCVQLGASPQDVFLSQDLTIPCWQRQHIFYICTLGLPLLLLYVVGVPVAVLYTLCNEDNKPRVLRILSVVRAAKLQPVLDEVDSVEQAPAHAPRSGPDDENEAKQSPSAEAKRDENEAKQSLSAEAKRDTRKSLMNFTTKMFTTASVPQQDLFDAATQTFHRNFAFMFLGYKVCLVACSLSPCFVWAMHSHAWLARAQA